MELVILVGLQAAGKSTFAHARFAATHVVVSKDHFPNNRRPGRRQRHLVTEALAAGRSVVVDNTNPTATDRAELIVLAREYGATVVGYSFPPDLPGSLARNAARVGRARVPDVGVFATLKRFQAPSQAEGFDRLFEVRLQPEGGFEVRDITGGGDAAG